MMIEYLSRQEQEMQRKKYLLTCCLFDAHLQPISY